MPKPILLALLASAVLTPAALSEAEPGRDAVDRLVILGSKLDERAAPGGADYVILETLNALNYRDVNQVLRTVPGVNIQEEDGFGLRPNIGLRGAGLDRSSKITLMEDGVLIAPAPYAAPEAYYFPHIARMSAVEVVKGAGSIKYGPRTQGGSINLVSAPIPSAPSAALRLSVGDFETARLLAQTGGERAVGASGRIGGLIQALQDRSGGFKELDGGGETGFQIEDYLAKVALTRNVGEATHTVSLKLQYSDERSDETYLGLAPADYSANPFRRYASSALDQFNGEHAEASGRWFAEFANGWDLGAVVYRTDFDRDWFKLERVAPGGSAAGSGSGGTSVSAVLADPDSNPAALAILRGEPGLVSPDGALLIRHNNRVYSAEGVMLVGGVEFTAGEMAHDLEVGLRVHADEMDRVQWWDRYAIADGALRLTGVDAPGTESNRIDRGEAISLFLQDTIRAGRWTISPGVRFEEIDLTRRDWGRSDPDRTRTPSQIANSVSVATPGLGVVYALDAGWDVFAGVHRGFAPPAPGQVGRDAEDAINSELGVRRFFEGGAIEALVFLNAYDNILGSCTASTGGGCTIGDQFNGGAADVRGMEASANFDLAGGRGASWSVPARFAYTYTHAEFGSTFSSDYEPWGEVERGDLFPYLPEHQLSLGLGLETEGWGLEGALSSVSETRAVAGRGAISADALIDARTTLDAGGWLAVTETTRLGLSVRNLTDEVYLAARAPAGLRPGAPRTVLVTLDARF